MKKGKTVLLVGTVIAGIILAICIIQLDTKGHLRKYEEQDSNFCFTVQPGFYQNAIDIEINAPTNCEIYYTLDSSEPDYNSIPYEGKIHLENATNQATRFANRDDLSSITYNPQIARERMNIDKEEPIPSDPQYNIPEDIPKCNVVRAVYYDIYGRKSKVITGSYFIGINSYDIKTLSLVSDPKNLFDYEDGIYVTGITYDYFYSQTKFNNWNHWLFFPANYRNKGRENEKKCSMTLFENNTGTKLYSADVGIRIQGGGEQSIRSKKSEYISA